jgi:hypothetical protein
VALPLVVTVLLAGAMTLALMIPFAQRIGPELVVRFVAAVVAALALMVASVVVSRPLVRSVCSI